MVNKKTREKIVAQSLREITFARSYKNARIRSWQKNENMYYGRKTKTDDSRANVELGAMQGFVHTVLSKIDNPLVFKFVKKKDSDYKKAILMNALREQDSNDDDWAMKDLLGKKQALIYGRAVYCYYADSEKGYHSHLENVDVYDFLLDPAGGGFDIESAFYMGRYGIVKTRQQLIDGRKSKLYITDSVAELVDNGSGNATEITQEDQEKQNRYFNFSKTSQRQIQDPDKYKFWEWYTTFEGDRYYMLMTDSGQCIRCELLDDIFDSCLWPFWSWAAFPDLTEFWTPSYCDYVREIFMAQSVSINQMLDNAEARNKPQKAIITRFVENLAEVKYRKDGYIRLKETDDVTKAIQTIEVPSLETPMLVYDKLETIVQSASGVTAGEKGVADPDGKATIYEGNQAASADRFGLLDKSYSHGYKRFAMLWECGVYEHLKKKVAVEYLGSNGVEFAEITKRDVKPYARFNYLVESSDAEENADTLEKRTKLQFLANQTMNPIVNQKKRFEMEAKIAGLQIEEIKELLDLESWGDAELMSEASRDIERILRGEKVPPNDAANLAYKQKIVDWMKDHKEDISMEDFMALVQYVLSIEPIVMQNTVRSLNENQMKMGMGQPMDPNEVGTEETQQQIPAPVGVQ